VVVVVGFLLPRKAPRAERTVVIAKRTLEGMRC